MKENIMHDESKKNNTTLESEHWIVTARWYYALLAFCLGLLTKEEAGFGLMSLLLIGSLALLFFLNALFYVYLRDTPKRSHGERSTRIFNMCQIGTDLIYFFALLLISKMGVESIGQSFFFIPIIISGVLLGSRGAMLVSGLSGILVLIAVVVGEGVWGLLLSGDGAELSTNGFFLQLAEAGIVFIIYLLAGFFGGYVSQMIRTREQLLLQKISSEENQVKQLEVLTKEFDKSAKLLVRRDIELSSANEKLVQLDQMKSEVISVVTHQLRTPLSAIKWTLKMLLDGDLGMINDEQKGLIKKGFDSNERMITLVNDMLAVDRLDSGRNKYTFVPIQFEDLVQKLISELLTIATQKKVRVEFLAPTEQLPKIKVS